MDVSLKDQTMAVLSFRKANLSAINKTTVPVSDGAVAYRQQFDRFLSM